MECYFYDQIDLRKGEIVKLVKVIPGSTPLTVSVINNISTGVTHRSRVEGVIMATPPVYPSTEIIGKVISCETRSSGTYFQIATGTIQDHVFVKAGEIKKGQDAIIDILSNQLNEYVKIWDPYISVDSIKLLSNVQQSVDILILTQKITDLNTLSNQVSQLQNKVAIRKGVNLHDRFILTKGEGWFIGHSLKDFGKKTSLLSKMVSSLDAETAFDETWNLSVEVLS